MPRPLTAISPTATTVISPITVSKGAPDMFLTPSGARLSPMAATIDPVTTGGISVSTQAVPDTCTMTPTSA